MVGMPWLVLKYGWYVLACVDVWLVCVGLCWYVLVCVGMCWLMLMHGWYVLACVDVWLVCVG